MMLYRVKCSSYVKAVNVALAFGKVYGEADVKNRQPMVTAGNHTFIFVWGDKKFKNEIPLNEFINKYFKEAK